MKKLITLLTVFIPLSITTLGFAMDFSRAVSALLQLKRSKPDTDEELNANPPIKKRKTVPARKNILPGAGSGSASQSNAQNADEELEEQKEKIDQGKKRLMCPHPGCTKSCECKSALNEHMRKHTQETPFKCTESGCSKSYKYKASLVKHVQAHTDARPYKCTEPGCSKSYAKRDSLILHTLTHTRENPLRSPVAPAGQAPQDEESKKQKSKKINHGKKRFKCTHPGCTKSYKNKSTLVEHVRTHAEARPYKCTVPGCTKDFTSISELSKHKRAHLGIKYKCTEPGCTKEYPTKQNLRLHILAHARKNPLHPPVAPAAQALREENL